MALYPLASDDGWIHMLALEMPSSSAVPESVILPMTKPHDCDVTGCRGGAESGGSMAIVLRHPIPDTTRFARISLPPGSVTPSALPVERSTAIDSTGHRTYTAPPRASMLSTMASAISCGPPSG
eukprot:scaffold220059_cov30-Tisochrysis_lutea.AAC.4